MEGRVIERCFVNLVLSMVLEDVHSDNPRFASQGDFSKAAFPNEPNHAKIWQAIKQGQKNSPRKVSVEEAYSMASALGESLDRLLVKAELKIEEGWGLNDDIYFSIAAKQPGRPKKKAEHASNQLQAMQEIPSRGPVQSLEHETNHGR